MPAYTWSTGDQITAARLNSMVDAAQPWQFRVEDYGALGDGTTDDTAAIRSALAAAVTYASGSSNHYVELVFQPKTYVLSGGLVQGGATKANAQIPLPWIADSAPKITIVFKGFSEPTNNHWNTTSPQIMGTVLKSTLTGLAYSNTLGMPAIIGTPTPEQSGYGVGGGNASAIFSNLCVVVDGIQLQAPSNPSLNGFDFRGVAAAHIVKASALGASIPSAIPALSGFTAGLLMPLGGNNDYCEINQWTCGFWYAGVAVSEHTNAVSIRSIACAIGIRAMGPSSHAAIVQRANVESCHTAVLQYVGVSPVPYNGFDGINIRIAQLDVEDAGTTVIDDSGNHLRGEVVYTNQGGGINVAGVNGAQLLRIINFDQARGGVTAPTMPATTVALINPFYRDAAVNITGGTVTAITVGALTTGLTSGTVIVPSGGGIALTYSSAPTWKWTLL